MGGKADTGERTPPRVLQAKIDKSIRLIKNVVLEHGANGVLAWSGGKDAIVAGALMAHVGIRNAVCEESFVFARVKQDYRMYADMLGLKCVFKERLDMAWLRRHPEIIFTSSVQKRAWFCGERQQKSVKEYAFGIEAWAGYGRRTEENSVPKEVYTLKQGVQLHPIRDWSSVDVWSFIAREKIPPPFIYGTLFGDYEGNAPFFALRAEDAGSVEAAWKICSDIDPEITKEKVLGL